MWLTGRITKNRKTIFRTSDQDFEELKKYLWWQLEDIMDVELRLWNHNVFYSPDSSGDLDVLESMFNDLHGISPKDFFEINRFCEDFGIHVSISKGNWI